jgi:hypothetical protein
MQNDTIPAAPPIPAAEPAPPPQPPTLDQPKDAPAARPELEHLFQPAPSLAMQPASPAPSPAVIDAAPVATLPQTSARRRGRIARLPKIQRDMVNRMLANGVPYKNIVAALQEAGFSVIERNISNWAKGGYLEWQFYQNLVIDNSLAQDHLVDHLRREDAPELAEVGLQAAATRLSQILLQKAAHADNVEADLGAFSQMVDILSRLNREISLLQKQRDDSRRTLGPAHDVARIKNEQELSTLAIESDFSDPDDPDCGLDKPADPPFLPAVPTSRLLEIKDLSEKCRQEKALHEATRTFLQAFARKNPAPPATPAAP